MGRIAIAVISGTVCAGLICLGISQIGGEVANGIVPVDEVVVNIGDTSILEYYATGDRKDVLLKYLAANVQWKVTRERGAVVAYKYPLDNDGVRREQNYVYPDAQIRIMLRLSPYKYGSSALLEKSSQITPGAQTGAVRIYDQGDGEFLSYVSVPARRGTVWLDVLEVGRSRERTHTERAIREIVQELKDVRELFERNGDRYLSDLLPDGSTRRFAEPIAYELLPGNQPGLYQIRGFFNAGQPGYIRIRLLDPETGEDLLPETWALEYVGWSPDTSEKFCFQSPVTIPRKEGGNLTRRVRVAVYFQSCERLVDLQEREFTTWAR